MSTRKQIFEPRESLAVDSIVNGIHDGKDKNTIGADPMAVTTKRVYEAALPADGARVLVDRLWPRGLSKEKAAVKVWLRDLAPSDELRKWFHATPDGWTMFRKRYLKELKANEATPALTQLYELVEQGKSVTLLFAYHDAEHNNAVVLKDLIDGMKKPPTGTGPAAAVRLRNRAVRKG